MTTVATPPQQRPRAVDASVPQRAAGVELIGEYDGSGYVDPHYLARRADGSVVQLARPVFVVAEAVDGTRDYAEVAAVASEQLDRTLSADNVRQIAETKLRPTGVLTNEDGSPPEFTPLDPLLALKFRTSVVPARAVRALTRVFRPLFLNPLVVVALLTLGVFDVWLFFLHGVGGGVRRTLFQPLVFFLVLGLIIVSAAFHECGHATGCAASGAKPGRMGVALYLAWPAFYTDVTDAYRLGRRGRLRTDLGGIYFNALTVLALAAVFLVTRFEPLLVVAFLLQIEIVHQLLPFIRLDGYYIVSDLIGVPDLFGRIGPILTSLIPGRDGGRAVAELKPWARRTVRAWVLVVVPFLAFNVAMVLVSLPRIIATAWVSAQHLVSTAGAGSTSAGGTALALTQLVTLALPLLGIALMIVRVLRRLLPAVWRWSAASRSRRVTAATGTVLSAALLLAVFWPDQDYRPYGPHDRGTLQEEVASVFQVGGGTPVWSHRHRRHTGRTSTRTPATGPGQVVPGLPVLPPGQGGGISLPPAASLPGLPRPALTSTGQLPVGQCFTRPAPAACFPGANLPGTPAPSLPLPTPGLPGVSVPPLPTSSPIVSPPTVPGPSASVPPPASGPPTAPPSSAPATTAPPASPPPSP